MTILRHLIRRRNWCNIDSMLPENDASKIVDSESTAELYQIADELRAIANQGLIYGENAYDRERYQHILAASARLIAAIEKRPPEKLVAQFCDNLFHVSPLAGVECVVLREGRILLIRRRDDGLWALPGGLVEVGETLVQAAERELLEEANVRGRVVQFLGLFDSRLWQTRTKAQLYTAIFKIATADIPAPAPETLGARFFAADNLPDLSQGHHLRVPMMFRLLRGEIPIPYFDGIEESDHAG